MAGAAKRMTEALVRHLAGCNWADPYEPNEVLLWRWADSSHSPEPLSGDPGEPDSAQRIRRWDISK